MENTSDLESEANTPFNKTLFNLINNTANYSWVNMYVCMNLALCVQFSQIQHEAEGNYYSTVSEAGDWAVFTQDPPHRRTDHCWDDWAARG